MNERCVKITITAEQAHRAGYNPANLYQNSHFIGCVDVALAVKVRNKVIINHDGYVDYLPTTGSQGLVTHVSFCILV